MLVQDAVEVVLLPVETDVRPTTLGYPSQRVMTDVTLVVPGRRCVSVMALDCVTVLRMASSQPYQKEDFAHVLRVSWHFEAYSIPDPVLSSNDLSWG